LPKELPDLIILDLMLPDADGFDVCKQLRANSQYKDIPIIMLTAKSEEMDRVLGLEFGADDYVVKPFSPRELVARVKAILRRGTSTATEQSIIEIGDSLSIDTQKYEVKVQNTTVNLTSTEFKLLYLLAKRPGWVYSRNQILDYLWGNDKIVIDRTIDVHIRNLRDKLGIAGKMIKNVRGVGYKLEQ
jgi:two-component system phosphate regulon response regulator PhoB/two-component system alkaline phosphatase synthesis response regulator PhoP